MRLHPMRLRYVSQERRFGVLVRRPSFFNPRSVNKILAFDGLEPNDGGLKRVAEEIVFQCGSCGIYNRLSQGE